MPEQTAPALGHGRAPAFGTYHSDALARLVTIVLALGLVASAGPSSVREPAAPSLVSKPLAAVEPSVGLVTSAPLPGSVLDHGNRRSLLESYGKLPLRFEANRGQTADDVKFLSRGSGYTMFLTSADAVLVLRELQDPEHAPNHRAGAAPNGSDLVLRMKLAGANPASTVTGLEELPGKANYFVGNDPTTWRAGVPTYGKVKYANVYPGIDLVYYGNQRQLEHDFIVAPGGDPSLITLTFEGAERLELDARGDLVIHTAASGRVHQSKPVVYQEVNGVRQPIAGSYVLRGQHHVGFQVAAYDPTRSLVIDPVLVYSTYLGGSNTYGCGLAVDRAGNAYVSGWTDSIEFPVLASPGRGNAFVVKINPTGDTLIYETFFGDGTNFEVCGIAVDQFGSAYTTGVTASQNFPTTAGAFQPILNGFANVFVTKLDPTGSMLLYSTYLGGGGSDASQGIAVDAAGNAYVTGFTDSSDFPTTPGAFRVAYGGSGDAFVTKLTPDGSALVYSTFLGGSSGEFAFGIAIDSVGGAYVTGSTSSSDFPTTPSAFRGGYGGAADTFVTKLTPDGSALAYSTFLGERNSGGRRIAVDSIGNAYVAGGTRSGDLSATSGAVQPVPGGRRDAFVTKLTPDGSALVYFTYLGGSQDDWAMGLAIDDAGNAYVTGPTYSYDFPITPDALQTYRGGSDGFVTVLDADGTSIVYSTFLGGGLDDRPRAVAVDGSGNVYVTGFTTSPDFPSTNSRQATFQDGSGCTFFVGGCNAFITKIALGPISGIYRGDEGAGGAGAGGAGDSGVSGVGAGSGGPGDGGGGGSGGGDGGGGDGGD